MTLNLLENDKLSSCEHQNQQKYKGAQLSLKHGYFASFHMLHRSVEVIYIVISIEWWVLGVFHRSLVFCVILVKHIINHCGDHYHLKTYQNDKDLHEQ